MTTSARLLALLGLLQSRSDWTGAELAERLDVTDRTVRNDIDRLREPGLSGRGRPRSGRLLPARHRHQAAAAAARRRRGHRCRGRPAGAAGISRIEETSVGRWPSWNKSCRTGCGARSPRSATRSTGAPENTGANIDDPDVDPGLLSGVAAAIRDHERAALLLPR